MIRYPLSPTYDDEPQPEAEPAIFRAMSETDLRPLRAFWRGMFCGVILTLIVGSLAAVLT